MGKVLDLTGQRFGRFTVVRRSDGARGRGCSIRWICKCDCGTEKPVLADSLISGRSKSCRCLSIEITSAKRTTHGLTKTREHRIWSAMKTRCSNEKAKCWPNYGGRGISVCERWRHSFEAFLADMGPCPDGHSIDRIDVNGNYEPSNCRWADSVTQGRNQRRRSGKKFRGIIWNKRTGKYCPVIRANGRNVHLGSFAGLEAAVAARLEAEERYWCGVEPAAVCLTVAACP